jgi:hypothetical protein
MARDMFLILAGRKRQETQTIPVVATNPEVDKERVARSERGYSAFASGAPLAKYSGCMA